MRDNKNKFELFSTIIRCRIDDKNVCIPIDKIVGYSPFFKYDDNPEEWLHLKFLNRYKLFIFIQYNGGGYGYNFEIRSDTILNDATIIFHSYYKYMTRKHKIYQPKSILALKLYRYNYL